MNTEKYTVITPVCVVCGKPGELAVSASEFLAIGAGLKAQDALPTRSADFREQLISGTHPACWTRLFGDDEDDDDQSTDLNYCGDCGQSPCESAQDPTQYERGMSAFLGDTYTGPTYPEYED